MGVCDVPHGLSGLKKTICQIKCSLLAWWALKDSADRMYVNTHPPSFLCILLSMAFSGSHSFPQALLLSLETRWVLFFVRDRRVTVYVREAQRQIFCQQENSLVCLQAAEAHQKHVTIKAESPNRAIVLLSSVSFPLTWTWDMNQEGFSDPLFKFLGWSFIHHLPQPWASFSTSSPTSRALPACVSLWGQRALLPSSLPLCQTSARIFNELWLCCGRGMEVTSACWIDSQITLIREGSCRI